MLAVRRTQDDHSVATGRRFTPRLPPLYSSRMARRGPMPLEPISDVNPGDVILIHGTTWLGALIRFFLRLRFRSTEERRFAHWSHAALVVSPKGHIVEVSARGVGLRELARYKGHDCLH